MRTLTQKRFETRLGQAGMASILVTMVLMIVISLIVLGFAQVSRRNQRAALDNQLSNQAFYAAETGVNDYVKYIKSYLLGPSPLVTSLSQNSCTQNSTYINKVPASGVLSTSPDVAYTCVLVDASPTSLQYGSVGSTALIIPINATTTVNSLTITWQTTRTDLTFPANNCPSTSSINQFPTVSGWAATNCGFGIMRVDLVPTTPGPITLQSLQANTMTAFLVPTRTATGSGTLSYSGAGNNQYGGTANQGAVTAAKCDNTAGCSVTINGLSSPNYYLRINSIYQTDSVEVKGYNNSAPTTPLPLGSQILIDSTGKAQDVLRRIQVRIPISADSNASTFDSAIQSSQSLCKKFQTYPGSANDVSGVNGCALP